MMETNGTLNGEMKEKKLFTPGPLGVSLSTKQAMLRDLGSRDTEFIHMVKYIREQLVQLAGVSLDDYTCVPIQGSGSFAVEAVLTTSIPCNNGKLLLLENGAYGKRMGQIADVLGVDYKVVSFPETSQVCIEMVQKLLQEDNSWTNVAIVHCETSSGVINPVEEVGKLVKEYVPDAFYIVDAMSSFGAIPLNLDTIHADFMVSSANKCLEGVPGFSYAIAKKTSLQKCKGWSRSLCLDLVAQWEGLEKTGQFRFTPPTHAMLAFNQALMELHKEGGITGRSKRYQENRRVLQEGMKAMGFKELLDDSHKGYIITSYYYPDQEKFDFKEFYTKLQSKGQVIYPGKVTKANCFRIGNIGHLFPEDMRLLLTCIREVCYEMGITLPLEK
ncbi:2-aminoethylphosphonate--pyruvate transaminase-like [Amphiura filiformis]|uniref:2-aminoethylphosphonate--pyruvate transaminase-like n=1 Tax=Amphiura filiformis TaxID=82378 RepID=UPI003B211F19